MPTGVRAISPILIVICFSFKPFIVSKSHNSAVWLAFRRILKLHMKSSLACGINKLMGELSYKGTVCSPFLTCFCSSRCSLLTASCIITGALMVRISLLILVFEANIPKFRKSCESPLIGELPPLPSSLLMSRDVLCT